MSKDYDAEDDGGPTNPLHEFLDDSAAEFRRQLNIRGHAEDVTVHFHLDVPIPQITAEAHRQLVAHVVDRLRTHLPALLGFDCAALSKRLMRMEDAVAGLRAEVADLKAKLAEK